MYLWCVSAAVCMYYILCIESVCGDQKSHHNARVVRGRACVYDDGLLSMLRAALLNYGWSP